MIRRVSLLLALLLLCPALARAHIGSPDVFFEGKIGPYPARVVIRMPPVVPGRAQIEIHPASGGPLQISVLPLFAKTAIENSPPPEPAAPVADEPGSYRGDLWLMREGGYSVAVKVRGEAGEGEVQIPVNSVALQQLPFPRTLATILVGLAGALVVGGLAIVRAAAGESTLPPGAPMDALHQRKGVVATSIAAVVGAGLLAGGWHWWSAEEAGFRRNLQHGLGPDLEAEISNEAGARVLRLNVGEKMFSGQRSIPLLPDHGKLLHLFLIGERGSGGVAHLHPVRRDGKTFETTLPPLPGGTYRVFADLTLASSAAGLTSTATIQVPPLAAGTTAPGFTPADPDDSWAICAASSLPSPSVPSPMYRFDDGLTLRWKPHPTLRVRHDAGLAFEVCDSAGQPVALEPYMGMQSHAAVMKVDGSVFAHLHPTGNFSMAAQMFFTAKVDRASGAGEVMDHSKMHHGDATNEPAATFTLPYEFPSPGDYRVWVQFKTGGKVHTACFEAAVAP